MDTILFLRKKSTICKLLCTMCKCHSNLSFFNHSFLFPWHNLDCSCRTGNYYYFHVLDVAVLGIFYTILQYLSIHLFSLGCLDIRCVVPCKHGSFVDDEGCPTCQCKPFLNTKSKYNYLLSRAFFFTI